VSGRIVVLVSGSGSTMEALARACARGDVPGRVVAVLADRCCAALDRARALGTAAETLSPAGFASRAAWSEALLERVLAYRPELVVSAGFMRVLGPVFVRALAGSLINLHPSLLPRFPGAHAVRDALAAGARVTGTTVHFVDEGIDTGEVIAQQRVPVLADDTEASLHERIKRVERELLPAVCRGLLEGRTAALPTPVGSRARP
jgi:phosphoribosylglycinamide formyltransferase 1